MRKKDPEDICRRITLNNFLIHNSSPYPGMYSPYASPKVIYATPKIDKAPTVVEAKPTMYFASPVANADASPVAEPTANPQPFLFGMLGGGYGRGGGSFFDNNLGGKVLLILLRL